MHELFKLFSDQVFLYELFNCLILFCSLLLLLLLLGPRHIQPSTYTNVTAPR